MPENENTDFTPENSLQTIMSELVRALGVMRSTDQGGLTFGGSIPNPVQNVAVKSFADMLGLDDKSFAKSGYGQLMNSVMNLVSMTPMREFMPMMGQEHRAFINDFFRNMSSGAQVGAERDLFAGIYSGDTSTEKMQALANAWNDNINLAASRASRSDRDVANLFNAMGARGAISVGDLPKSEEFANYSRELSRFGRLTGQSDLSLTALDQQNRLLTGMGSGASADQLRKSAEDLNKRLMDLSNGNTNLIPTLKNALMDGVKNGMSMGLSLRDSQRISMEALTSTMSNKNISVDSRREAMSFYSAMGVAMEQSREGKEDDAFSMVGQRIGWSAEKTAKLYDEYTKLDSPEAKEQFLKSHGIDVDEFNYYQDILSRGGRIADYLISKNSQYREKFDENVSEEAKARVRNNERQALQTGVEEVLLDSGAGGKAAAYWGMAGVDETNRTKVNESDAKNTIAMVDKQNALSDQSIRSIVQNIINELKNIANAINKDKQESDNSGNEVTPGKETIKQ